MATGKFLAITILEQYKDHCETTLLSEDTDKENLKNVTKALEWVKKQ